MAQEMKEQMRTEDGAVSDAPEIQTQLDRLEALAAGADGLGLDRVTRLLSRLGHPERALPPVFHVAGTNGKGSTCAFLRAALELDGRKVHVYTSPHLVRFNERIRVGGRLIDDALLADLLEEVLDVSQDIGPSFFEATTAAAFLAFSRNPADACIIEVGLGGRLDATNVVPAPVSTGIAQLGLDHQSFLGADEVSIAREKAGISKPGVPLITMGYDAEVARAVAATAVVAGAQLLPFGAAWKAAALEDHVSYQDRDGSLALSMPALAGPHQPMNAALATAMLRHQNAVRVSAEALEYGPLMVEWPARLQRIERGPVHDALGGRGREVWLDGGHNPAAGKALAQHLARLPSSTRRSTLILGMLSSKDPVAFVSTLVDHVDAVHLVPIPGQNCHDPLGMAARLAPLGIAISAHHAIESAMDAARLRPAGHSIIIAGSLHLAGHILKANHQPPR